MAPPAPHKPHVVILRSSDNALFEPIATGFSRYMDGTAEIRDFTLRDAPDPVNELVNQEPNLVFALGTKAALAAHGHMKNVALLVTMAVGAQDRFAGLEGVMGIAIEPAPAFEFAQYRMIVPSIKTVLLYYTEELSGRRVAQAREQLTGFGVDLLPVQYQSLASAREAYASLKGKFNSVWLFNDPVALNCEMFEFLHEQSREARLPLIASMSASFSERGALMSVSVDTAGLGAQAAALARRYLEHGEDPREIGIQLPVSTSLVVNLATAQAIGIELPNDVLQYVDRVVRPDIAAAVPETGQ